MLHLRPDEAEAVAACALSGTSSAIDTATARALGAAEAEAETQYGQGLGGVAMHDGFLVFRASAISESVKVGPALPGAAA